MTSENIRSLAAGWMTGRPILQRLDRCNAGGRDALADRFDHVAREVHSVDGSLGYVVWLVPRARDTPLIAGLLVDDEARASIIEGIAIGRVARPDEYTGLAAYPASDESSRSTGAVACPTAATRSGDAGCRDAASG